MSKIANAIRKAMRATDESRYSISKATGIDQAQLSKLLSGRAGLGVERLEELAEYLGLEIIVRVRQKKGKTHGKH